MIYIFRISRLPNLNLSLKKLRQYFFLFLQFSFVFSLIFQKRRIKNAISSPIGKLSSCHGDGHKNWLICYLKYFFRTPCIYVDVVCGNLMLEISFHPEWRNQIFVWDNGSRILVVIKGELHSFDCIMKFVNSGLFDSKHWRQNSKIHYNLTVFVRDVSIFTRYHAPKY